MTDRLGRLLLVTLEAARVNADLPVPLGALRSWLDSWRGIGDVERGMARQGYDLQLTRYDAKGWRATFYTTGMEHSITSATASAWERTPWHAVQGAARNALRQAYRDGERGSSARRPHRRGDPVRHPNYIAAASAEPAMEDGAIFDAIVDIIVQGDYDYYIYDLVPLYTTSGSS